MKRQNGWVWALSAFTVAVMFGGLCFAGEPAKPGEGDAKEEPKPAETVPQREPTPNERTLKALQTPFAEAASYETPLSDFLALLGKVTGTNIVLDPALPDDVKKTQVIVRVNKGGTASEALGVALAIAGLRFILADGTVFVSTPGKLADKLVYGESAAKPFAAERASQPMTVGDAAAMTSDLDDDDGFVPIDFAIRHTPWRIRRLPYRDRVTGLMQYPAPPVWMEDPDVGSPRFRFSHVPSFLKPEYLAEFVYGRDQKSVDAEALNAVVKLLRENPDMSSQEVLEKLGMSAKKPAKPEKTEKK